MVDARPMRKLTGPQGGRHPTKWKLYIFKHLNGRREWLPFPPERINDGIYATMAATDWANYLDKQRYLL